MLLGTLFDGGDDSSDLFNDDPNYHGIVPTQNAKAKSKKSKKNESPKLGRKKKIQKNNCHSSEGKVILLGFFMKHVLYNNLQILIFICDSITC